MPAYKDKKTGNWYLSFYYENWQGEKTKKLKRGFDTKKDALEWERNFLFKHNADLNMTFHSFVLIYYEDMKSRLKQNTWLTKVNIIETKILPYFNKKVNSIEPRDVIKWQNEMINYRDENGKGYSQTYLKTIHNQLSCIFNFGIKYYGFRLNPAKIAGSMGKSNAEEMNFWTYEEYLKFSEAMMVKPLSFIGFEILYYCGLRIGELLALKPSCFDFDNKTMSIKESYQCINGEDILTEPKTPKSRRTIELSDFLVEEIKEYLSFIYGIKPNQRMFPVTKKYFHHEMIRGTKEQSIKKIRVHDIRHSSISRLMDLGFTPFEIAERVGHESITTTLRYSHLLRNRQKDMAKKLNDLRKEAMSEEES